MFSVRLLESLAKSPCYEPNYKEIQRSLRQIVTKSKYSKMLAKEKIHSQSFIDLQSFKSLFLNNEEVPELLDLL